jgi:hypothetical protein
MYWGGGAGHVAISDGAGNIYTTDLGGTGTVTKQSAALVKSKWGKPYLGWADPYFQGKLAATITGSGTNSLGGSTPASGGGTTATAGGISQGFLAAFLAPFTGFLKIALWGLEAAGGAALMVIGGFMVLKGNSE